MHWKNVVWHRWPRESQLPDAKKIIIKPVKTTDLHRSNKRYNVKYLENTKPKKPVKTNKWMR